MTTLIVKPIRLEEPGSYKERKRFLRLLRAVRDLSSQSRDPGEILRVLDEADQVILARVRTDDDTPVEQVLETLSANDFDALLSAIAFESGSVGEASAAPSETSTEGAEVTKG